MSENIEIKARVADPDELERKIEAVCGPCHGLLFQKDTFYQLNRYRIKLRNVNGKSELIIYSRSDAPGPKQSKYLRIPIPFPQIIHALLSTILGVRGKVRKKRTLFFSKNTRIHLDEVDNLGNFLEFEVVLGKEDTTTDGVNIAKELMQCLGVKEENLISGSYIDLLENNPSN